MYSCVQKSQLSCVLLMECAINEGFAIKVSFALEENKKGLGLSPDPHLGPQRHSVSL